MTPHAATWHQSVTVTWEDVVFRGSCSSPNVPGGASGKEPACQCGKPKRHRCDPPGLGFLVAQMVKNLPAMWETWVGTISWRRAWQPTSVFLPGESPWTEEPGGLQSMGLQRVRCDWAAKHTHSGPGGCISCCFSPTCPDSTQASYLQYISHSSPMILQLKDNSFIPLIWMNTYPIFQTFSSLFSEFVKPILNSQSCIIFSIACCF